jgi:N-acetylneuraminic acid mutarotase
MYADLQVYSPPPTDSWTYVINATGGIAQTEIPTAGGFLAAIGGKLYLYVPVTWIGFGNQYVNRMYSFDTATLQWTRIASPPHGHLSGAGAVVGNNLYLIGGGDDIDTNTLVDIYDPSIDTWVTSTQLMPTLRQSFAAAVVGSRIVVVGGIQPGIGQTGVVEAYDTVTDKWYVNLPSLNSPRGFLALAAVGSTLYAIGGGGPCPCFSVVEALETSGILP